MIRQSTRQLDVTMNDVKRLGDCVRAVGHSRRFGSRAIFANRNIVSSSSGVGSAAVRGSPALGSRSFSKNVASRTAATDSTSGNAAVCGFSNSSGAASVRPRQNAAARRPWSGACAALPPGDLRGTQTSKCLREVRPAEYPRPGPRIHPPDPDNGGVVL